MRVGAVGDARQGRARLALAAGAEVEDLVAREVAGLGVGDEGLHALQQARPSAPPAAMRIIERPTRQTRRPLASAARMMVSMRATLEAKQATATLPFSVADQGVEGLADLGLRAGLAVDEDVGGIADHGQHALVAEAADGVLVGGARR